MIGSVPGQGAGAVPRRRLLLRAPHERIVGVGSELRLSTEYEAKLMWRGKSAPTAQRNAISLFRKIEVQAIGHREYETQDCLNRLEN